MTKLKEKMTELELMVGEADSYSKMIELISEKMVDVHCMVGIDGSKTPTNEHSRLKLGKDVLTCMSALEGVNKALERTVESLSTISGEIEMLLLKEAK